MKLVKIYVKIIQMYYEFQEIMFFDGYLPMDELLVLIIKSRAITHGSVSCINDGILTKLEMHQHDMVTFVYLSFIKVHLFGYLTCMELSSRTVTVFLQEL